MDEPPLTPSLNEPDPRPVAAIDFRNLGVLLRILLAANAVALWFALARADRWSAVADLFLEISWRLQPLILASVLLLALIAPRLRALPGGFRQAAIVGGVGFLAIAFEGLWQRLGLSSLADLGGVVRLALFASAGAWLLLHYLDLRARAARPAIDSARLAALTARIRPHFLFNSLNAVLSLIRSDPRRAEAALENLSELYRELMRDPGDLVPLSREIALCRQYLELERLRLGERLAVQWTIDDVPMDLPVPPLMLQPLLENAVRHGIEASDEGGELAIGFRRDGERLRIDIANALPRPRAVPANTAGNQMALDNIRQRLMLYYDIEATLLAGEENGRFVVTLLIPTRRGDR